MLSRTHFENAPREIITLWAEGKMSVTEIGNPDKARISETHLIDKGHADSRVEVSNVVIALSI